MKLVTVRYRNETRMGAWLSRDGQDYFLDLNRAQPNLLTDVITFLQAGDAVLTLAQHVVAEAEDRWLVSQDTPSGTSASLTPPVYLRPGDAVCVRIEKIGELINPVVCE